MVNKHGDYIHKSVLKSHRIRNVSITLKGDKNATQVFGRLRYMALSTLSKINVMNPSQGTLGRLKCHKPFITYIVYRASFSIIAIGSFAQFVVVYSKDLILSTVT